MGSGEYRILYTCIACIAIAGFANCLGPASNSNDLRALQGFLESLESGFNDWLSNSSDFCSWRGVTCKAIAPLGANNSNILRRVVGLELENKSFHGVLSKSLAGLDQLRELNLARNHFSGSVPLELLQLEKLEVLDLSSNSLSGVFPSDIKLPSLRYFNISNNQFLGNVDSNICNMSRHLQVLDISGNKFSGKIPLGFGNCCALENLFLNSNSFNGNIPEDMFQLGNLSLLNLGDNMFSGVLSPGLGNLANLVTLDISANDFSGNLPNVFQSLGKLKSVSAKSNKFTGHLPSSLTNSSSISYLNLNKNAFSGAINLNFSAMIHLTSLDLGSNQFYGPIPESLSSCRKLESINLARNNLGGQIPEGFSDLKSLSHLSLANTSLHNISAALEILQECKNLTMLILTLNFRSEAIPADLHLQFKKLQVLVIANCRLTGVVPSWLSDCAELQMLDLSWNHLSGTIPAWIGSLENLFYLDLSNNSLSQGIPKELAKLLSLTNGTVPQSDPPPDFLLFRQRLSYKQIGRFRPSIDLSYNMLNGSIWPEFGNLRRLHMLNLKKNNLSGYIPSSLSTMTSLEVLDLSYNSLTGSIPFSLAYLHFLSNFSVAFNQLSGETPSGGQFTTFTNASFEGNKGLCGFWFSPCLPVSKEEPDSTPTESPEGTDDSIIGLPFGFGFIFGFITILTVSFMHGSVAPPTLFKRNANR